MSRVVQTFPSHDELVRHAFNELRVVCADLAPCDGVMLSGGRTPLDVYRLCASEGLSPSGHLFLSDERFVPASDPQSNQGAISSFFPQLMAVPVDLPLDAAAEAYHELLESIRRIPLGLLGLGSDGHTASLFTATDASLRSDRLAIAVQRTPKPDRISVTRRLLQRVDRILILADGSEKAGIVQTMIDQPLSIPAGMALAGHEGVELWTAP